MWRKGGCDCRTCGGGGEVVDRKEVVLEDEAAGRILACHVNECRVRCGVGCYPTLNDRAVIGDVGHEGGCSARVVDLDEVKSESHGDPVEVAGVDGYLPDRSIEHRTNWHRSVGWV